jgi:hypothetical protein
MSKDLVSINHSAGVGLVAAALLIKAVVLVHLADHPLLQPSGTPDSSAYVALAERVIAGDWLLGSGSYFVSPLYIYFVAAVSGATGSLLLVKVAQVLLGAMTVWLVWWMTHIWCGARAASIAGVLTILTGLLTFYEVSLLQASLDPILTASALAALTAALSGRNHRWFAASGLLFGLQILNRPNVLIAVSGVVLVLALRRQWRALLLLLVGILVAFLPIGARNIRVTGEFTLLPSHGGLNLLIGNGPEATGLYRRVEGIRADINGQAVDARRVAEQDTGRPMSDRETSRFFIAKTFDWIQENPGAWLALMTRKVYYTLHAQHFAVPLSFPFFARDTGSWLGALVVGPWLLVSLGLAGLLETWKSPPPPVAQPFRPRGWSSSRCWCCRWLCSSSLSGIAFLC